MLKAELEKFKSEGPSVEEVEIVATHISLPTPPISNQHPPPLPHTTPSRYVGGVR